LHLIATLNNTTPFTASLLQHVLQLLYTFSVNAEIDSSSTAKPLSRAQSGGFLFLQQIKDRQRWE
jgi:hypothetical protein